MVESKKPQMVALLGAKKSGKSKLFDELIKDKSRLSVHSAELVAEAREVTFAKTYESTPSSILLKCENTSYIDTPPFNPAAKLNSVAYYGIDCAIVVVDSTNDASFTAAQEIIKKVQDEYPEARIVLAVTKTDLIGKRLGDLDTRISGLDIKTVVRTSALTGAGIDELKQAIGFESVEEVATPTALSSNPSPRGRGERSRINPAKRYYATLVIGTLLALAAVAAVVLVGLYVPGAGALMMNIVNFGVNTDVSVLLMCLVNILLPFAAVLSVLPTILNKKTHPSESAAGAAATVVGIIATLFFGGFLTTMLITASDVLLFTTISTAIAAVAEITAMVLTPVVVLAASAVHYAAVRAFEEAEAAEAKSASGFEFNSSLSRVAEPGNRADMGTDNGSDKVLVDDKATRVTVSGNVPTEAPTND